MSTFSITGLEDAAYVLFREAQIASDPWDRRRHTKLLVREVISIAPVLADDKRTHYDPPRPSMRAVLTAA